MTRPGRSTDLGSTRNELSTAWKQRLDDARILFRGERFDSAVAMGLYALEILLKERICRNLDVDALPPDLRIHDLAKLIIYSGLSRRLSEVDEPLTSWNAVTKNYGNRLNDLRYGKMEMSRDEALEFFRYLGRDPANRWKRVDGGIVPWITRQR